jgi:hypothetical protein
VAARFSEFGRIARSRTYPRAVTFTEEGIDLHEKFDLLTAD